MSFIDTASIIGIVCTLEKVEFDDAQDIINLRNQNRIRKFLSNKSYISLSDQISWQKKQAKNINDFYLKIIGQSGEFGGTISLYNIKNRKGEFGRYICVDPIMAIDSELCLLKLGFEVLGLEVIYCRTVLENEKVWKQHKKFGFKDKKVISDKELGFELLLQEITKDQYYNWNYESIKKTIHRFA